jgi:phospholipid-binding lipoprotein MlaA
MPFCRFLRSSTQRSRLNPALGGISALALLLGACSSNQQAASPALDNGATYSTNDPLEGFNRVMFKIDMTLDKYALRPVAKAYRDTVPAPVRVGLTNVLHNIKSPIILMNDVLQGNGPHAGDTFVRIWLNTICGVGGIIDVGAHHGYPYHDSDFGQTLGVWGIGPGPYLVLPLLGPSDPRDAVGFGVDSVVDPFSYAMREAHVGTESSIARTGATVINDRSQTIDELDELQRSSLDFYAAVRSLYQQKREGDVNSGRDRRLPGQSSDLGQPIAALPPDALPAGGPATDAIPMTEPVLAPSQFRTSTSYQMSYVRHGR